MYILTAPLTLIMLYSSEASHHGNQKQGPDPELDLGCTNHKLCDLGKSLISTSVSSSLPAVGMSKYM